MIPNSANLTGYGASRLRRVAGPTRPGIAETRSVLGVENPPLMRCTCQEPGSPRRLLGAPPQNRSVRCAQAQRTERRPSR